MSGGIDVVRVKDVKAAVPGGAVGRGVHGREPVVDLHLRVEGPFGGAVPKAGGAFWVRCKVWDERRRGKRKGPRRNGHAKRCGGPAAQRRVPVPGALKNIA